MTTPQPENPQNPEKTSSRPEPKHVTVDRINASRIYAMWSVFTIVDKVDGDREAIAREADEYLDSLAGKGVTVRGTYNLSGFRAEADLMIWWHGESIDELQKAYSGFLANTIASFGMGDYEWILAFEADEMHRILDLMREMRYTEARRHVREETPFFSGPQITMSEFVARMR